MTRTIKNTELALDIFNRYTTYNFDESDVSDFIFEALSCHEPSSQDFSDYNEETETGDIYEEHTIEVSPYHTKDHTPLLVSVGVTCHYEEVEVDMTILM